jgi:hypothetical protein
MKSGNKYIQSLEGTEALRNLERRLDQTCQRLNKITLTMS